MPPHPAPSPDVVIVGAGPSGLAVGACLAMRGVRARLLERGAAPGWSWVHHYDALRLHTSRSLSGLPGLPFRSSTPYPDRGEVVAYLAAYARKFSLEIDFGREVTALAQEGDAWRIDTPSGVCHARHVILATGSFAAPRTPDWPGRDLFRGRWLRPEETGGDRSWEGRRVLIVGLGNTAADLVADLRRRGARVALSVRGPVRVVPREILALNCFRWSQWVPERAVAIGRRLGPGAEACAGRMAASAWFRLQERRFGDLRSRGLVLKSEEQIRSDQEAGLSPVVAGPWVDLIRSGEVPVFPGIAAFTAEGAIFADGRREEFDDVVLAIGYAESRFGLAGELPSPLRDGPVPGRPGLWMCGAAPVLWRIRRSAGRIAWGIAGS